MTKQEAHDQKIKPLMDQIIKVCQEHNIAMLTAFCIPTPEEPALACVSALCTSKYQPTMAMLEAWHLLFNSRPSPGLILQFSQTKIHTPN